MMSSIPFTKYLSFITTAPCRLLLSAVYLHWSRVTPPSPAKPRAAALRMETAYLWLHWANRQSGDQSHI
jgi:hypothetical protein